MTQPLRIVRQDGTLHAVPRRTDRISVGAIHEIPRSPVAARIALCIILGFWGAIALVLIYAAGQP